MSRWRPRPTLVTAVRAVAAAAVLPRLARAARAAPPISPALPPPGTDISVVVPARDEAERIGPLLDALRGAPAVAEVVVVDDESTDETAALARRAGATVVHGAPLPAGWAGKAWALQQGLLAATSTWTVCLDADTRPDPALPAAAVARAIADDADLITVAGRFECPTRGVAWLHPAMLTTLVYRFGPPGAGAGANAGARADRLLANGQCMVVRRDRLLDAGGLEPVRGHVVEDVALARHIARSGGRVLLVDGARLLRTRMFETLPATWRGWSRSLALPGLEPPLRRALDVVVLAGATVVPLARLLAGRADALDVVLLAARGGTLAGTRRAYESAGPAYWVSPLADPLAVAAVAIGSVKRSQTWRGRRYPHAPHGPRARTAGR